jgi:Yip1 domain
MLSCTLPDSSGEFADRANQGEEIEMSPAELIARVQRLLLSPATEWASIDGEGADVTQIYQSYILPLVGIGAILGLVGLMIIGVPIVTALESAILNVALSAGSVYVMALIIDALATQFGAKQDFGQAFKVAAYSPTAAWVGSFFMILPVLWFVALIGGLYSLYLLFVGLPKLMKPAADKAMIYTLAVIGCMIVIGIVAGMIVRTVVSIG